MGDDAKRTGSGSGLMDQEELVFDSSASGRLRRVTGGPSSGGPSLSWLVDADFKEQTPATYMPNANNKLSV
jgi:hypothetical protein